MVSFSPLQSVGGLASGLDTQSILNQLLAVERQPRDKLAQQQTLEQAREDALGQVQARLATLQNAAAALSDVATWSTGGTVTTSDGTKATGAAAAGATPGTYYVSISQLAQSQQKTQTGTGFTTVQGDDTLHIRVGSGASVDVAVSNGDDVNALASKINAAPGIGVTASVQNGKLVLDSNASGASATIAVTSSAAGNQLANELNLTETRAAQDASFIVNNTSYTSSSNTSTAIPGVTLNLLGVSSTAVTLTVSADTTKSTVTSKVQTFVSAYNSLVDYVTSKLNEQRVQNPQTDADRQKGMLRSDTTLESLLSQIRTAMSDTVDGAPAGVRQFADVGLSTGASTGSGSLDPDALEGKLTLDTSKLSTMLDSNFADVKALFTKVTGSYSSEGLAQRINRRTDPFAQTGGLLDIKVQTESSMITSLGDQMTAMDVRLATREQTLRAQFTQMETALSQLQSQSSWLSGQIAGLSK
jgi:flagellar hook-associated protein 2